MPERASSDPQRQESEFGAVTTSATKPNRSFTITT